MAIGPAREDGARVAQPDVPIFRWHDLGRVADRFAGRGFGFGTVDQQADRVGLVKRAHHRRHVGAWGIEVMVPLRGVSGPGGPDRLLRRPFGRHGEGLRGQGQGHAGEIVIRGAVTKTPLRWGVDAGPDTSGLFEAELWAAGRCPARGAGGG